MRPRFKASVRGTAIVVSTALFLEILDVSIVAIALPEIGESFAVDTLSLKLTVTLYILGLAMMLPGASWIASRFGAKQVFITSLALFCASSMLCGLAAEFWQLLLGRFSQGFFGALMVPVGRSVILQQAKGPDLVVAMIWFTMPALVAPVIAPPLGGVITAFVGWHWIFLVNLPICIIGIIAALWVIPETKPESKQQLDWLGWVVLATGFACGLLGLEYILGESQGQRSLGALLGAIGLGLIVGYARFYRRKVEWTKEPVLSLKPLADRVFSLTQLASIFYRFGLGGVPIIWPLMLQIGKGASVLEAGLATSPLAIGALSARFIVTRVLKIVGFTTLMMIATILSAGIMASVWFFSPNAPLWCFGLFIFVFGVVRSIQLTALNSLCYANLESTEMSAASTLSSMVLHLGLSVSVTIGFFTLAIFMGFEGTAQSSFSDFQKGFVLLSLISLLAMLPILALPRGTGDHVASRA